MQGLSRREIGIKLQQQDTMKLVMKQEKKFPDHFDTGIKPADSADV